LVAVKVSPRETPPERKKNGEGILSSLTPILHKRPRVHEGRTCERKGEFVFQAKERYFRILARRTLKRKEKINITNF